MDIYSIGLKVDSRQVKTAQKDLGGMGRQAKQTGTSVRDFGRNVDKSTRSIGGMGKGLELAKRALGGFTAALAVRQLQRFATASIAAADAIDNASRTAGVGAERLQELRFAFGQLVGTTNRDVDAALRRFNRRLGEAQNGAKGYQDALKSIGVAVNQETEPALNSVLNNLSKVESSSERSRVAAKLFGEDAGPALAAALAEGIGAMDDAASRAVVMSDEIAQAGSRIQDDIDAMASNISTGLQNAFLGATVRNEEAIRSLVATTLRGIGTIVQFGDELAGPVGAGILGRVLVGKKTGAVLAAVTGTVQIVNTIINRLNESAGHELARIEEQIDDLVSSYEDNDMDIMNFPGAASDLKELKERRKELDDQVVDSIDLQKDYNQQLEKNKDVGEEAGKVLFDAADAFEAGGTSADKAAQSMFDFGEESEDAAEKATDAADEIQKEFDRVADSIEAAFSDAFFNVFDDGIDAFGDLADSIFDIFKRTLADMAAAAIRQQIVIPITQQIVGGAGDIVSGTGQLLSGGGVGGVGRALTSPGFGGNMAANFAKSGVGESLGLSRAMHPGMGQGQALTGTGRAVTSTASAATSLAGMGGSFIGSEIGGGTVESSVGATAGQVIGAALGGPVGAFIGGIVGGAFGGTFSDEPDPSQGRTFINDVTGQTEFFLGRGDAVSSEQQKEIERAINAPLRQYNKALNTAIEKTLDQTLQERLPEEGVPYTKINKFVEKYLSGDEGSIQKGLSRIMEEVTKSLGDVVPESIQKATDKLNKESDNYGQQLIGVTDVFASSSEELIDDLNEFVNKTNATGQEFAAQLQEHSELLEGRLTAQRLNFVEGRRLRQEKEDALQQEIIDAYDKRVKEFGEIRNSLILSGDAAEAAAEQFRLLRGDPKEGDAVGFPEFLRLQRDIRQTTSSLALEVENVEESLSGVMASFSNLPGALNSATKLGEATVGEFFTNVTERAQEASMGLRKLIPLIGQRQLQVSAGDALTGGVGILGVRAAETELRLLRKEFRQYPRAVDALREANEEGVISSEEFATVMRTLNHELEEAHAVSLQVADAENKRAERLRLQQEALDRQQNRIIDAGIDSIRHYFGQLGEAASSLEENFSEVEQANNAVDIATSAIGRFNSASTVFTESVDAITGALSSSPRVSISGREEDIIDRSEAIASAADRLSEIVTTQDASRAQEELEDSAAFADETNSFVREVALMLQGVSEFDIPALENSFLKLSGSFSEGNISQDQYNEAIDFAVSQFEGLSSETEKLDQETKKLEQEIQEVQSTFESLADAARSLIDELLVSEQATGLSPEQRLLEARRQQREVFDLASAGDEDAISQLSGVTDTFLDTAKSLAGSAEEYNRTFFSTIGQLESLEERGLAGAETDNLSFADGGIASGPTSGFQATLHGTEAVIPMNGQRIPLEVNNQEMIQELRDLRQEVSQLRTEQGQSQYQITKNTKRTKETLEQFDIEGLPPERSAT